MKPKPALGLFFWLALGAVGFVHLIAWPLFGYLLFRVQHLVEKCGEGFPLWPYFYGMGFSELLLVLTVFWGVDRDRKTLEAPPEHREAAVWTIRKRCWGCLLLVLLAGPVALIARIGYAPVLIKRGMARQKAAAASQPATPPTPK